MSWLDNAVIYQIFIDRFAGFNNTEGWEKPDYLGGNLKGISEKLPYIKDLGVDAIWISPFNNGVAYHGYHITDFNSVDEHFGNEKDLKELIDSTHSMGMKMICDYVPNHCSNQHPYFIDAISNKYSEYRDWFIFKKWPDDYLCFMSYKELPKLNLENSEVRKYLIDSARKWLQLGLDGYRIDHIIGISNKNIKRLLTPLREEFPDAIFIGEAWLERRTKFKNLRTINVSNKYLIWWFQLHKLLYKSYVNILDGVLDFQTSKFLEHYANGKDNYAKKIISKSRKLDKKIALATFLDNHDMERFLFRCGGDISKLKKAATLQFSLNQPAIIYYGTEIGMTQKKSFSSLTSYRDILAREPMYWDIKRQNVDLLNFYKKIVKQKNS